jgi:dTDP-glucose pyrophosphorylase
MGIESKNNFNNKFQKAFYKKFSNWKLAILDENKTVEDAIKNLNKTGLQVCFVHKKKKFVGTISDGDIRRSLLKGSKLSTKCSLILNKKPHYINKKKLNDENFINNFLTKFNSHPIPIIDSKKKIINIFYNIKHHAKEKNIKNWELVVVTGGKGTRLYPLTKKIPKALININGKPILEKIINKAREEGITKCNLITNHFHQKIHNYFGNGKNLGVSINYFKEKFFLGTAGGLKLLEKIKNYRSKKFIITNCDTITDANYEEILQFHKKHKNQITVVSKFYSLRNPYGVIELGNKENLLRIDEKPTNEYLINAGIYVINGNIINYIKKNQKIDMTSLINNLVRKKIKIGTWLVHENLIDIGTKKDISKFLRKNNARI